MNFSTSSRLGMEGIAPFLVMQMNAALLANTMHFR